MSGLNKLFEVIGFISHIWGELSQDGDELCMVAEGTHTYQTLFYKNRSKEPTEEQHQLGYRAQRLQLPPFVESATT